MTESQKEQYYQLKQQFLAEAGDLIQLNEIKKREEELLTSQIHQKEEIIQNFLQEQENTRVNDIGIQSMIEID